MRCVDDVAVVTARAREIRRFLLGVDGTRPGERPRTRSIGTAHDLRAAGAERHAPATARVAAVRAHVADLVAALLPADFGLLGSDRLGLDALLPGTAGEEGGEHKCDGSDSHGGSLLIRGIAGGEKSRQIRSA